MTDKRRGYHPEIGERAKKRAADTKRKHEELVKIAMAVHPCPVCISPSCDLARKILKDAGYRFLKNDALGIAQWSKK